MKTKYDWLNVPKEVKWIATDKCGAVCGYACKPHKFSQTWNTHHTGNFISHSFVPPYQGNWQDSLEERPNEN